MDSNSEHNLMTSGECMTLLIFVGGMCYLILAIFGG
jgi:hypothetical protein